MAVLSEQVCSQLAARGLRLYSGVNLGGFVRFRKPSIVYSNCTLACISIGSYSYINAGSSLSFVSLGNYCSLAYGLDLGMPRHLPTKITTSSAFYAEDSFFRQYMGRPVCDSKEIARCNISAGHDVWIGAHCQIPAHRDITIGTGAVIAAGSVVTKDIPSYCVVGGNPARIIKLRFKEEICQDLLNSHWYDYDLPRFMQTNSLSLHDPVAFLREFAALKDVHEY